MLEQASRVDIPILSKLSRSSSQDVVNSRPQPYPVTGGPAAMGRKGKERENKGSLQHPSSGTNKREHYSLTRVINYLLFARWKRKRGEYFVHFFCGRSRDDRNQLRVTTRLQYAVGISTCHDTVVWLSWWRKNMHNYRRFTCVTWIFKSMKKTWEDLV
jgi:hypothetical protein